MQETWVPSLVGEWKFHMLQGNWACVPKLKPATDKYLNTENKNKQKTYTHTSFIQRQPTNGRVFTTEPQGRGTFYSHCVWNFNKKLRRELHGWHPCPITSCQHPGSDTKFPVILTHTAGAPWRRAVTRGQADWRPQASPSRCCQPSAVLLTRAWIWKQGRLKLKFWLYRC